MKLDNLEVGQVIKNYKELCQVLGLKGTTGEAKQNQMAWIEEYISYEKAGYKFIINEISDKEVEPMTDGREDGNNRVEYLDFIEKLTLDLMLQQGRGNKIYLSQSQLLKQLKMVNENYAIGKLNIPELSMILDIDRRTTEDYYDRTDAMLEGNIISMLNSLANQALIVWSKVTTVDIDKVIDTTVEKSLETAYNADGEEIDVYEKVDITEHQHREATEEEDLIISRAERETLIKMKRKNKGEIIRRGEWNKFSEEVRKEIQDKGNINYYYSSYKVLFHNDLVQDRSDELAKMILDEAERLGIQFELNTAIQDRSLDNAQRRHKKAKECFGQARGHRGSDEYVESSRRLNEGLLDLSAPDMRGRISQQKRLR